VSDDSIGRCPVIESSSTRGLSVLKRLSGDCPRLTSLFMGWDVSLLAVRARVLVRIVVRVGGGPVGC